MVALSKIVALSALTEGERADRDRRLNKIRSGRHPDTGIRLHPSDRKTLKPGEAYEVQMYFDWIQSRTLNPISLNMLEMERFRVTADMTQAIANAAAAIPRIDPTNTAWSNGVVAYREKIAVPLRNLRESMTHALQTVELDKSMTALWQLFPKPRGG